MSKLSAAAPTSNRAKLAGQILSGLAILFFLMDALIKLPPMQPAIDATVALGWPAAAVRLLGILLLVCTALYAYPRTAFLGAILLTGYLGGAVATHLRIGSPLFTHVLFGVYLGLVLWGGLYLRNAKLRELFTLRS